MVELFKLIWGICCLRRGPQDLPYAPALLALACVLWLGFQALVDMDAATVSIGVLMLAINLGVLFGLLFARGLRNRFVQTATALFGCALVFDLLILPLSLLFGDPNDAQGATSTRALIVLATLLIMSWKLIVEANIFRSSLNVPFMAGMMLAITWFMVELYAVHAFAPPATAG